MHLIGPGGAGKSTTAPLLAEALELSCIDLDREYLRTAQIDKDVDEKGDKYYVRRNIDLYLELTSGLNDTVIATSSGFMTYANQIHLAIPPIQQEILASSLTVLLLPSFDVKICTKKTINRLLSRPYESKSVSFQRQTIEERFLIYRPMGNVQVTTNLKVEEVVSEIQTVLAATE